jgi:hypothetical protein
MLRERRVGITCRLCDEMSSRIYENAFVVKALFLCYMIRESGSGCVSRCPFHLEGFLGLIFRPHRYLASIYSLSNEAGCCVRLGPVNQHIDVKASCGKATSPQIIRLR